MTDPHSVTDTSHLAAIRWRDPATWLWLFGLAVAFVVATVCPNIASGLIVEQISGPRSDIITICATEALTLSLWLLIIVPLYAILKKRLNVDAAAAASEQRTGGDYAVFILLAIFVVGPSGFMVSATWSWLNIEVPVTIAWAGISAASVAAFSSSASLYLRRRSTAQP